MAVRADSQRPLGGGFFTRMHARGVYDRAVPALQLAGWLSSPRPDPMAHSMPAYRGGGGNDGGGGGVHAPRRWREATRAVSVGFVDLIQGEGAANAERVLRAFAKSKHLPRGSRPSEPYRLATRSASPDLELYVRGMVSSPPPPS